ncbi:unnamed protein product [Nesidiocoris tenuis]|uniref:Uncharacterized protein n=1 Tax=Nesidiocoris tenuis TaxID=355587 RepID=A0A6H5GKC9_9HEMI|nr:unnamed protein product [Nesidiocoris tenuis]
MQKILKRSFLSYGTTDYPSEAQCLAFPRSEAKVAPEFVAENSLNGHVTKIWSMSRVKMQHCPIQSIVSFGATGGQFLKIWTVKLTTKHKIKLIIEVEVKLTIQERQTHHRSRSQTHNKTQSQTHHRVKTSGKRLETEKRKRRANCLTEQRRMDPRALPYINHVLHPRTWNDLPVHKARPPVKLPILRKLFCSRLDRSTEPTMPSSFPAVHNRSTTYFTGLERENIKTA